jgi:hypothetical protein
MSDKTNPEMLVHDGVTGRAFIGTKAALERENQRYRNQAIRNCCQTSPGQDHLADCTEDALQHKRRAFTERYEADSKPCRNCGLLINAAHLYYSVRGISGCCKACYDEVKTGQDPVDPVQSPKTVLEEAGSLIYGDRMEQYGNAERNFGDIGRLWEPILGRRISPEEVALCLLQLKVARAINDTRLDRPIKRDTIVDLAGYAGCIEKIQRGV